MLFDRGHPCFWNFNSIIPVDVIRVKSYVNSLFNPTGVPMWVIVTHTLYGASSQSAAVRACSDYRTEALESSIDLGILVTAIIREFGEFV